MSTSIVHAEQEVRDAAHPLTGDAADLDALIERIGDARAVLLGEATHGTHEFYRLRAAITRRLIEEKGFDLVAVEADWPDAYRVNRWVRGAVDGGPEDALGGFARFPTWMWRNRDVVEFIRWLRAYNEQLSESRPRVGFYGLDLYALYASISEVLGFLETVDTELAGRARSRYACFDHFAEDSQAYGYAASFGMTRSCEDQAVQQLVELQQRAGEIAARDGRLPEDEIFFAEQNARLIVNAEQYYRTMFGGRVSSWNLRDRHMADTLEALVRHFARKGQPARVVVWEHNSHIGDARATQMGAAGEWNVGQLAREAFGADDVVLVGFTTFDGNVTAADAWDGPAERMRVRPALEGSCERLFHQSGIGDFLLLLDDRCSLHALAQPLLERAIGVIYRPQTERLSHYFEATLTKQFDAVIHVDRTRALEPLERTPLWASGEPPETFPHNV